MARKFLRLSFFILLMYVTTCIDKLTCLQSKINPNSGEGPDYVLCRLCGADLASNKYIINHLSPKAEGVIVDQTIFERKGVEIQILENPLGIQFPSITFSTSECAAVFNWQKDDSWYPGYAWRPCICSHCGVHHGWIFEPLKSINDSWTGVSDKGFFVLILNTLLSEKFADSLIVTPKPFQNSDSSRWLLY